MLRLSQISCFFFSLATLKFFHSVQTDFPGFRDLCLAATATAKSLQSYPTLCNPIDSSPPGPTVPGILQARTLEWVAISFFNAWKWKVKGKSLSCVELLVTQWTAAYQAPPPMGFSRQEYWSGVPLPSPLCLAIASQTSCTIPNPLILVFTLPSFAWLCIPFWWSMTPSDTHLVLCENFYIWRFVPDISVERDPPHSPIFLPSCWPATLLFFLN